MDKFDKKVTKCCGVLNLKQDSTYTDICGLLNKFIVAMESVEYVQHYFAIVHDDSETLHIHFALLLDSQRRLLTLLNKICDLCGLNTNQVTISELNNINAVLRYFIHMSEDKKKYRIEEIKSDFSLDDICSFINNDTTAITLTSKQLIIYVLLYNNECDLMAVLGLQVFHKYRSEIRTLYDHLAYLNSRYGYLLNENTSNNLPF